MSWRTNSTLIEDAEIIEETTDEPLWNEGRIYDDAEIVDADAETDNRELSEF